MTDGPPIDVAGSYAAIRRLAAVLFPGTRLVELRAAVPDGSGGWRVARLPIPMAEPVAGPAETTVPPDAEDLSQVILDTLGRLKKDEYLGGEALAAEVGSEKNSGTFRRSIKELRDGGQIEAHPKLGYRLRF